MSESLDYRQAGVNIEAGEQAVERIRELARSTFRPGVLADLGGFGGLFAPDLRGMIKPVLVAGCDGVGTKLKLAFATNCHHTVGIDCVAMCVNDILVQGAEPLFFLDYLALGTLKPDQVEAIVSGVAEGCRQAGCALLGGEMAEMPGFYPPGEYDLAGFAVGIADQAAIIDGSKIIEGDLLVGLTASGIHSNGLSLARKVLLEEAGLDLAGFQPALGSTLAEELLKPTRIYVKPVLQALQKFKIKGMAHITGGGLPGNLPRILPEAKAVELDSKSWNVPPVFQMIEEQGPVERKEMFRVFNMGIGFVIVVAQEEAEKMTAFFNENNTGASIIGRVTAGKGEVKIL